MLLIIIIIIFIIIIIIITIIIIIIITIIILMFLFGKRKYLKTLSNLFLRIWSVQMTWPDLNEVTT